VQGGRGPSAAPCRAPSAGSAGRGAGWGQRPRLHVRGRGPVEAATRRPAAGRPPLCWPRTRSWLRSLRTGRGPGERCATGPGSRAAGGGWCRLPEALQQRRVRPGMEAQVEVQAALGSRVRAVGRARQSAAAGSGCEAHLQRAAQRSQPRRPAEGKGGDDGHAQLGHTQHLQRREGRRGVSRCESHMLHSLQASMPRRAAQPPAPASASAAASAGAIHLQCAPAPAVTAGTPRRRRALLAA
jgi:hypothetical protein